MTEVCNFLRACGVFWVTTVNEGKPASRPFGAVTEHEGELCITTSDEKSVYRQLKKAPFVQITAIKPGTREWIRIDGEAEETDSLAVKARLLKDCPQLLKYYPSPDAPGFAVFIIRNASALLCTDKGKTPV